MQDRTQRIHWFEQDRFGMFIHWGIYAIPAAGEWIKSNRLIPEADYQRYFEEFNPTSYQPEEWAALAKAAGMRYVVMTAKHHDGFCLFDSQYTDYKATNTPAGRDLIAEYVEAFRQAGLKVGFYYSLLDWHHPDYPAHGDGIHPRRNDPDVAQRDAQLDFGRYVTYLHDQVRELLSNYGKIDIIWFDFSYGKMTGEAWEATKLVNMCRQLQPHILIDNRLGGNIKAAQPEIFAGDFASPEQIIPPEGVLDDAGNPVPWEACITLNNHWGYCATDHDYKSPAQIIRALTECVSKNGNLLLNVGPDALGRIPRESQEILREVGRWMDENAASIRNCGVSAQPKPEWGRFTQNGNRLYAHILDLGIGPVNLRGLAGKIEKARLLRDGSELILQKPWNATEFPDDAFITFDSSRLPDPWNTVVELTLR